MSGETPSGLNRPLLRRLLQYREWLVAGRGFTAQEAVDELEVCLRTVYRDLDYLRSLGWDVEFSRRDRRWVLGSAGPPPPLVAGPEGGTPRPGAGRPESRAGPAERIFLRFSPAAARNLRASAWKEGEDRQSAPDGSLLLRFCAPVTVELLRFVLQYGAEVEVLAPVTLRRQVADAHRLAVALYTGENDSSP